MIGKVPLDQLAKDKNIEVEWKAFELRPEGMELPPKSPEYLKRAQESIQTLGKRYGLTMVFNPKSEHSRHALEGAKFAEERGLGNEYHDAMFATQFQQEKDINNLEVITEIAAQIGLNPEEFHEALVTRKYEPAVLKDLEEARDRNIQGVPYFIVNGRTAFGVQSYEALEALLSGKSASPFGL